MDFTPKFREYTKSELKTINKLFTPYLFYKDLNSRKRHCICTYCRNEYDVTSDNWEVFTVSHNEDVICEKCGRQVKAKSIGKAKSCKNLYEQQRVVTIYRVNENTVHILADTAVKRYTYSHNPNVEFYKSSRYVLQPGKVRHYDWHWYSKAWSERNRFSEPFYIKNNGGCYWVEPDNGYYILGIDRLKNTFLKYQLLDDYEYNYRIKHSKRRVINFKSVSYLCQFAMHPQMEMLQKLGYYDIVYNLVELNNKSYPYVNWKSDNLAEFLKLSKQELKEFRRINGDLRLLKMVWVMKKYFKSKNALRDSLEISEKIHGAIINSEADLLREAISDIKRNKLSVIETIKYIIKQQKNGGFDHTRREYFDYYRMAKDIGYDFSNYNVLYPPQLTRAHDLANETHVVWLEEQKAKEEARRDAAAQKMLKKKDKQYCFTDGRYLIIVPHSTKEILREGREQKHCVGGYAGRHMEGKLTICFMRAVSEPDNPLYTIEMHDKKLTQVQGYNNRTPLTPDARAFFDKWLEWVKFGSKRNKLGEPIFKKVDVNKTA